MAVQRRTSQSGLESIESLNANEEACTLRLKPSFPWRDSSSLPQDSTGNVTDEAYFSLDSSFFHTLAKFWG
jgi:hypothetical protein